MSAGGSANAEATDAALVARLRGHVEYLAGDLGPRLMDQATWAPTVRYIEAQLAEAAGPVQREPYAVGGQMAENLVVDWPGTEPGRPTLIVGAHYDTVANSPGADDNASAVAALIEMARLLRDARLRRPVRWIAFANEEDPHGPSGTMGSQHHAAVCRERGEAVTMVALEMLGFYDATGVQQYPWPLHLARGRLLPRHGDFIGMVSNLKSATFLRRFSGGFRRASDFRCVAVPLPHTRLIRRSDHGPFWDVGYPALMVTDTSFLRNPHYHQPTDTPSTLDYAALAAVTRGLAGAVAAYAG
jgi:Zn-dependent M28 family amino/carboxypeptidase